MINVDNNIRNSDWIKNKTWDLPTNVQGFLNAIGGADNWEHFKTLPAYKPMPESLRHDVDAHVRAREAHTVIKEYNPDQPRDELGRFGEMGTPQERLDRFNSSVYAAGQGVVLKGKELRAKQLEKMQLMAVLYGSRAGSRSDESYNNPEQLYAEMKEEKYLYNNFDMRVLGSGFIYSNGPIQIQATTDRYLKDGGLDAVVAEIERLQETNPISSLDVRIGERGELKGNDYAAATLGGGTMWLSPSNLMNPATMNELDPKGEAKSGWFMPSAIDHTHIQSVISHEWGHLMDKDRVAKSDFFVQNLSLVQDNISRYGGKDIIRHEVLIREYPAYAPASAFHEAYAELFSEWNLTGGSTTNPAAIAAAKEFKW